jgi:hypothetical protein
MKTHVMKRSAAKQKEAAERFLQPMAPEDYSHGLRIRLEHPELEKLGINALPAPGDKYRLAGELHVTDAGQEAGAAGSERHVGGVLHALGLEALAGNSGERQKSIREEIEDARQGRIGARLTNGNGNNNNNG